MSIRTATPDDLAAIMTLERASFPTDAWSEAMMREELTSPHGCYLVSEEAGVLVGYAGLRAPRGARDADIQTIAIAEGSRGRGRGRALLHAILAEASARRVQDVFLEVRADNPVAQALYTSEGFAEVGRRPRYYQPDDVDAVVMRLDLGSWAARRAAGSAYGGGLGPDAGRRAADSDYSNGVGSDAPRHPNLVPASDSASRRAAGSAYSNGVGSDASRRAAGSDDSNGVGPFAPRHPNPVPASDSDGPTPAWQGGACT